MNQSDHNKKNFKSPPKIIGIFSGKGGVGKSTLTAELALSLHRKGLKVGVLDGDLYGPSMRILLPEEKLPKAQGDKVVPASSGGIEVISSAYFPQQRGPIGVRAPIANQIIAQFVEEVEWGPLDFLLVDFPPGTGDIQLTLMQKLSFDGALVVSTPDILSLIDVEKAVSMGRQMGVPLLGLVENMSYYLGEDGKKHYLFGKGGGSELAKTLSLPLLMEVPIGKEHLKNLGDLLLNSLNAEKRCKIIGEDPYHFSIEWWDGKKSLYRYDTVQSLCRCMECEGKKKEKGHEVKGIEIIMIGKYGIQVQFSRGCSKGIYPFSLLRAMDR
ncbi:MAG: P-loop NTPase [Chlamydiales bacterium]|nr:P-loop NTPase [Chlamydiales bacterium]